MLHKEKEFLRRIRPSFKKSVLNWYITALMNTIGVYFRDFQTQEFFNIKDMLQGLDNSYGEIILFKQAT